VLLFGSSVPLEQNSTHAAQLPQSLMAKKLFPGLMLVLRRLTQTEEERCPDERPRSFLTEAVYNILAELS
jgi:hypothetical protein